MNKLQSNIFMMKRSFKAHSKWCYEWQTINFVEFERLSKRHGVIMEESIEDEEYSEMMGKKSQNSSKAVKASLSTGISFEEVDFNISNKQKSKTGCKIVIRTKFNANGYCTAAYSRQMLLRMYKDIAYFEDHYLISKVQLSFKNSLFNSVVFDRVGSDKYIYTSDNEEDEDE